ncbi:hypothetical protein [Nereida sp. MMG025]|uniref:hypothetical protein n=1 Tax=Nereida sp. MMG025 TaxID=2909981 RepID=UPI001F1AF8F7|nr:hypothetical protein [Nereida sp. MMG025]MCF6445107.1 hypothetical protein [Nereida sp. MMG025]
MTKPETSQHDPLDPFFDAAKRSPQIDLADEAAFLQNVLAQAQAMQPTLGAADVAPPKWWQRLAAPMGGLGALSGLAAAAVTGVMIGITSPDLAAGLSASDLMAFDAQTIDLEYEMGLTALFEEN